MSTETITLTLPDGSAREFPADATPLEVARTIGERLAKAAVAGQLDGTDRGPAGADQALGEVPRAHAEGPRGGGRDPALRRARARGRGRARVPGHDHRRRAPGPLREVPVRLPHRPRLHPGGPREDRGRDGPHRQGGPAVRAPGRGPPAGRRDLREPEGRDQARPPGGHPRGRRDHAVPARRVRGPVPRAARAAHRPDRRVQADRDLGRLLQGRRAQRDAAAHLRHRVRDQGGARRLLREDRGGAPPRPPPARARSSTCSRSRRSRRPRRSSTRRARRSTTSCSRSCATCT